MDENDSKYNKLIKNLEENGIGVNKIYETTKSIGLELTQFIHPDLYVVEEIITQAKIDSGINKNIKKDLVIADLKAISEIDSDYQNSAKTIYERKSTRSINTANSIRFRPFLASQRGVFQRCFHC